MATDAEMDQLVGPVVVKHSAPDVEPVKHTGFAKKLLAWIKA